MILRKVILSSLLGILLLTSQHSFGQTSTIPETEKPNMIVISANYGLLFGYSFFVEHRGSKRTGKKELYKKFENDIINMGNPSDAMSFMNNSGYDLLQVYSFPKGTEGDVTINYVFKKKEASKH
jgi:hypothetical protein